MKIIEEVIAPLIHNSLTLVPLDLTHGRPRRYNGDSDALVVPKYGCIINCRSSQVDLDIIRGWRNSSTHKNAIEPTYGRITTTLTEFLDGLELFDIDHQFRTHRMNIDAVYKHGSCSREVFDLIKCWLEDNALPDLIVDNTRYLEFYEKPSSKEPMVSISSPMYLSEISTNPINDILGSEAKQCIGAGYLAVKSVKGVDPCDRLKPSMFDLPVDESYTASDEGVNKKSIDAISSKLTKLMTHSFLSLCPPELLTSHYFHSREVHAAHLSSLQKYYSQSNAVNSGRNPVSISSTEPRTKMNDSRDTGVPKSIGQWFVQNRRIPIVIVPRESPTLGNHSVSPLTSSSIGSFLTTRSIDMTQGGRGSTATKGPWYLELSSKLKIKIIDSGAASLLSKSNWEDVIAVVLAEQKPPPQWPLAFKEDPNSTQPVNVQLLQWALRMDERLALIYCSWHQEQKEGDELPGWVHRVIPKNSSLGDQQNRLASENVAQIMKRIPFQRNTRHADAATYGQLVRVLQHLLDRPAHERQLYTNLREGNLWTDTVDFSTSNAHQPPPPKPYTSTQPEAHPNSGSKEVSHRSMENGFREALPKPSQVPNGASGFQSQPLERFDLRDEASGFSEARSGGFDRAQPSSGDHCESKSGFSAGRRGGFDTEPPQEVQQQQMQQQQMLYQQQQMQQQQQQMQQQQMQQQQMQQQQQLYHQQQMQMGQDYSASTGYNYNYQSHHHNQPTTIQQGSTFTVDPVNHQMAPTMSSMTSAYSAFAGGYSSTGQRQEPNKNPYHYGDDDTDMNVE